MRVAVYRLWFWVIVVVGVVLDQVTKVWALSALSDGRTVPLLGSFFSLHLIRNPGAAFSLGSGRAWIFSIVSVLVAVLILFYAATVTRRSWWICLAFILAGAIGNLIDRLFRAPGWGSGHVVDFLNYNGWFIGNVADIYIVVAVAGIVILTVLGVHAGDNAQTGADDE